MSRRLATAVLTVALVLSMGSVAAAASGTATPVAASAGSLSVSATILPRIATTFAGNTAVVRANAEWQLSAELADGEQLVVTGGPTSGQTVVLPEDAHGVYVCLR